MSRWPRVTIAMAVLAAVAAGYAAGYAALRREQPAFATVSLATGGRPIEVPRSFFGLSTEYWGLQLDSQHLAGFERVLSDVRVAGGGPVVLRVGGDSADFTYMCASGHQPPVGTFQLTPAWFQNTAAVVRRMHLRLILDLNAVAHSPAMAGRLARAAVRHMPKGSIAGFEIGNEPDAYAEHLFRLITLAPPQLATISGIKSFTPAEYVQTFRKYAAVLRRAAPGVPLLGPAVAQPGRHLAWLATLAAAHPRGLAALTAHRYPLSACLPRTAPCRINGFCYPTLERLLGEASSTGLARGIAPAVRVARSARLPLRVDELNSVTCGGLRGVSNTFATALWLPDALFALRSMGAAAVNLHIRNDAINAPFVLTSKGLRPRPLLDGMRLFTESLGRQARIVRLRVRDHYPGLRVWAVRVRHRGLNVLVLNKGARTARVQLRLPVARAGATIRRLVGPSVAATRGVALQRLRAFKPAPGGYVLTVRGPGAALVHLQLRRSRARSRA